MTDIHDFTVSVLLIQLAFQILALMLWLHLSGQDGLRRERMIQLLEQRPIHITRVFRDDDSDDEEEEENEDEEEEDEDEEEEDEENEDEENEENEDEEDEGEEEGSEATVDEGTTASTVEAVEDDRTDLGEKKDQ
jgi:Mg-chelatase subunit ChlI